MKKLCLLIAALALVSISSPLAKGETGESRRGVDTLPEKIYDWQLVSEYVQPLIPDATSEDIGQVIYRTYERESPKAALDVILTQGKGTGSLYVPDEVKTSKGLMPASGYEVVEVGGRKAILETQSNLPIALAVKAEDNITLTIESYSLSIEEAIKIAEEILSSWKNTK
ncbi:MAG: hypothetical protein IJU31_05225 [Synergistaceae bacterium]|nr:hypothetical protein [Synergistaceae bacterium]